jgi:endonuclease/exonuclease/phosphatase family metal-dependent hydrolase
LSRARPRPYLIKKAGHISLLRCKAYLLQYASRVKLLGRQGVGWGVMTLLCLTVSSTKVLANSESPTIKVATFNMLHGGVFSGLVGHAQDLDRRLEMAVTEFRKLNLDIIGIQEASTSRGRGNTATRLADQLGFHYVYAPAGFLLFPSERLNTPISWLMNFSEGSAIISRFPITTWAAHDLPRCGRFTDPRVLLTATVHTPWGDLQVASTHTSGDVCQHHQVAEILRRWRNDFPALVMGDFNAVENSPAMSMFTPEHGFIDSFRTLNPDAPGLTCYQHPYVPTRTASRRVDYLFVMPGKDPRVRMYTSDVFLDTPRQIPNGQTLWPSDHYGVFAEVSITAHATNN